MRLTSVFCVFFSVLFSVQASQWSPEDYEIFSLNHKIQQDLGEEYTFYSWLGLPKGPKSSTKEISQAYRKLSRSIHPDKFGGATKSEKKQAEERFQRLSLVGNILRDQSLKKRYDYFYAKGFPTWKGTGYYYSKYRPGFVFTLLIVFLLVSGFHFVALRINRAQDFKRVSALKDQIKGQAWGGSFIPPADGSDRKLQNETGRTFVVKADGGVYYVDSEANNELIPLDENDINLNPGFKDSLLFKVPSKLWNVSLGRWIGKIDTTVNFENVNKNVKTEVEEKKKVNKKAQKGKKIELPNGKVAYSRPSGARKR